MAEPPRDDEESDHPEGSILFSRRQIEGEIGDIATVREVMAVEGFERGDLVRLINPYRYGSIHMSMAYHGSMAMGARNFGALANRNPRPYQFTERFSPEVKEKAWKLLEQFMNPSQYFAFMEGADIELENLAKDFRLIINKSGKFIILEGARGGGIVAQSGNVQSYKYPLGDEIAAFIDWFNHRTKELIAQWGCGTYGIVNKEEGR